MDRRLKTLSFPLPSNLERKQQLSSVVEMQCAGVRQSWAIAKSAAALCRGIMRT
jgi:hypothetical protein